MKIELKNIIAENNNRKRILAELSKSYNPFTGEGCSGVRIKFQASDGKTLFLLKSQLSASDFNPMHPNDNRFYHDFEFWVASVYRINGQPLKFSLAYQSLINKLLMYSDKAKFLILHASHLGITTICEAYILWRELFRFPGSDGVFCYSDARNRKRFRRFCFLNFKHNAPLFNVNPRSAHFLSNNIISVNNGITSNYFTTCCNTMAVNGLNFGNLLIADANASVVANPKNLYALQNSDRVARKYQSYNSSQLVIIEANPDSPHLGGFFNNSYRDAVNIPPHIETVRYHRPSWLRDGDNDNITELRNSYVPPVISGFVPIFIPWYADEFNARPLNCSVRNFWNSLSPHEYYLWEFYMCSLEQINWYRHASNKLFPKHPQKVYPSSQYEAIYHCRDLPKYYANGKLFEEECFHTVPCAVIIYKKPVKTSFSPSAFRKHCIEFNTSPLQVRLGETAQLLSYSEITENQEKLTEISLAPN